ncbi:MAG: hypothetical protein FWB96_12810 [Defluviitaleaceae bacterium]|nr:hypothetical protein [Defluviitaleaceae bacterium]MCL2264039.1 hypothetical protein [Defluviitaleaceae bacterium]
MKKCKKHKPKLSSLQNHHRAPKGECANCVYFAKQNCGSHSQVGGDIIA